MVIGIIFKSESIQLVLVFLYKLVTASPSLTGYCNMVQHLTAYSVPLRSKIVFTFTHCSDPLRSETLQLDFILLFAKWCNKKPPWMKRIITIVCNLIRHNEKLHEFRKSLQRFRAVFHCARNKTLHCVKFPILLCVIYASSVFYCTV